MLTLIDFYADWCGPCKIMKPIFEKVAPAYEGKVEFKEVDVEADLAASSKFGVMSIPTFVILKDGVEVDRKIGAMPEQMLKDWLNKHLS